LWATLRATSTGPEEETMAADDDETSGPGLVPCRMCQHRVAPDARTCPSCGTETPAKSQEQIDAERSGVEHTKKIHQRYTIGCVLVVFGLPLFVLFMLFFNPSKADRAADREAAERWCTRKAVETAREKIPTHRPSADEVVRGHDLFMRACMRNQGYEYDDKSFPPSLREK
jgi:hypothetical protein